MSEHSVTSSNNIVYSSELSSAKNFAIDLTERVLSTAVIAAGGVMVAAGPADMFHASFWEAVGVGGVSAVLTLVKGFVAKLRGNPSSASLAKAL